MILDGFISLIRDALYGDSITVPGWIAIGTGTTTPVGTDTTLETETSRKTCANSKVGDDTVAYATTWATTESNGVTLTEIGAVNAASAGVMANRQTFPGFNKTSGYELRIQVYIKSENN